MSRKWELFGPEEDWLPFEAVARLFGYETDSLRRLVNDGLFPPPRGHGRNQYYSGLDVAIIREMFGRWQPQDRAAPANRKADRET